MEPWRYNHEQNRQSLPSWSSHSSENMVESSNDYRGKIKKGRGVGGGGRDVIVNKEVRKGLTENITFEKGLKEVEKQATQRTGGRALQTEGTACAKALRQEQAWQG